MLDQKCTRSGNSSGGTAVSTKVKGRENSKEIEGTESRIEGWHGKIEWEIGRGETNLDNHYLKGKTNSLKMTSLDKKTILVVKSYNLYPLVPKG